MNSLGFLNAFADWPYIAWALSAAAIFYGVTAFAASHLHPDKKAALSLWLQGDFEDTWSSQFCALFDSVFGEKHWGLRCIALSAVASVAAVIGLWLLFDVILGLISLRADAGLTLTEALLLGAAINIIPDYISLYETRWLLKRFESIRNPLGQLGVLIADAVITGAIIYGGVALYLWLTGGAQVSVVEMIALFSFYAIFFWSTFLTSVWAWAYCLSSCLARLSARLGGWLDLREKPGRSLALLGGIAVFCGALAAKPVLTVGEDGRTAVDDILCDAFPESVCIHLTRLTDDEAEMLAYLDKACGGVLDLNCIAAGDGSFAVDPAKVAIILQRVCDRGVLEQCVGLGYLHQNGLGVEADPSRAAALYRQGCDGGNAGGCTNLGVLHSNGLGVEADPSRAAALYRQGCDGGNALGCANLGVADERGEGVEQDFTRAQALYDQACAMGFERACSWIAKPSD